MDNVMVSIIIPSLNVGGYITECVESAINQSLKEIEIICIDAGSTDGTWEKIVELSKQDERIRITKSDYRSYGYQVNMGIQLARGKYVAVLESDDYVDLNIYKKLLEIAEKNGCDYVKCGYYSYYTMLNGERFFISKKTLRDSEMYFNLIEPCNCTIISLDDWYLWNAIYNREFIVSNKIELSESPGAAFQDIGFIIQTNLFAKKAYYIPEPLYYYCVDRAESSSNVGKGLYYSYNEYNTILNKLDRLKNLQQKRMVFLRMAKSFMCCYGEKLDFSIDEDKRKIYYEWFKKILTEKIQEKIINQELLGDSMWETINDLLESEETYAEKIEEKNKVLEKMIKASKGDKIAIFGCGVYGFRALNWLEDRGYGVSAFFDNNEKLWGRKINDTAIMSPIEIKNFEPSTVFLIANEKNYREIKEQILGYGVNRDNIIVFR